MKFNQPDFLNLLRSRDATATSEVVHAYTGQLFKASLGLGFNQTTAEELVQRVWTTFFDVVAQFEGRSQVRTFLFGILYNKASELRREEKKHSDSDPIDEIMESKFVENGHWVQSPISPEKFAASAQTLRQSVGTDATGI